MNTKPNLDEGESFTNDASQLQGEAMPRILARFRLKTVGRTIVDAGYLITEATPWSEKQATPCLVLDTGEIITASMDDEGNGPGVLMCGASCLCETQPK